MNTQRKWVLAAGVITAGAALLAFGVPAQTVLIGGLVLLCPLMMLFMMGGHNTHGDDNENEGTRMDGTRDRPQRESK